MAHALQHKRMCSHDFMGTFKHSPNETFPHCIAKPSCALPM